MKIATHHLLILASFLLLLVGSSHGALRGNWARTRNKEKDACDSSWKPSLIKALQKWSDPGCYEYTYQRSCECMDQYTQAFRVVVENHGIVSVTSATSGMVVTDRDLIRSIPTVGDMFGDVERLCLAGCPFQRPAACNAVYDPTNGHVTSLFVDEDAQTADEETNYSVTDLIVNTCPP